MKKQIEIEIRGPLSENKLKELEEYFSEKGERIREKERVLIDYSVFLEDDIKKREKDIRLRVTNKIPEIIIKTGNWGGVDQRKELSVFTKEGEFDKLVQIFSIMGFRKGMLCVRKSKDYNYKGVEFSLVEVPGHSYYYEAERLVSENEDKEKTTEEIKSVCKSLDLEIFNKKDFFKYIKKLNEESNEIFDYKDYNPGYFKKRFNL